MVVCRIRGLSGLCVIGHDVVELVWRMIGLRVAEAFNGRRTSEDERKQLKILCFLWKLYLKT